MLADVVVDTNVLAHADNPIELRQADAISFVNGLLASNAKLCVDPGFSLVEAENRSRIGSEYLAHLSSLPFAAAALATLANSGRISFVSTTVPDRVRRVINRTVLDPSDRVFVRVAHNSDSNVLCSHDFKHLPATARLGLITIDVRVVAADEAVLLL